MKTVADGVAILIDDNEAQYRAPWIVRLDGSKVLMELRFQGHPYEAEVESIVSENGIYNEFAHLMLAQVMDTT